MGPRSGGVFGLPTKIKTSCTRPMPELCAVKARNTRGSNSDKLLVLSTLDIRTGLLLLPPGSLAEECECKV